MPRITRHHLRTLAVYIGGAVLIAMAMAALWLAAQIDARMVREENTISVPSDRRGPALEQALRSLSDAWREENRNR